MSTRDSLTVQGAGFLGCHLVQTLLNDGHHVTALDNHSSGHPKSLAPFQQHPSFKHIRVNVTGPFPDTIRASRVYHLACPASPKQFSIQPQEILDTCYLGTRNVLEAARRWGARVLIASTSEVYGNPERCPQDEKYYGNVNCFGPRACYDEGKRAAEALAYAYHYQHGVDIRIARIFNVYGPGMYATDGRVVCSFVDAALRGEDLVVHGDGTASRCFQYVDDCVYGLKLLMESGGEHGPVKLGSERETSIAKLAKLVVGSVAERYRSLPSSKNVHIDAVTETTLGAGDPTAALPERFSVGSHKFLWRTG